MAPCDYAYVDLRIGLPNPAFSERDPRTYAILGAALEVHKQLGCGFLEAVYQEALAIEFVCRAIPFRREVRLPVKYKGQVLTTSYCADFICFDALVVRYVAEEEGFFISGEIHKCLKFCFRRP